MTRTMLKKALIALFALVFVIGFIVNNYHVYFAVALVVILSMIVFVGDKVDKEMNENQDKNEPQDKDEQE